MKYQMTDKGVKLTNGTQTNAKFQAFIFGPFVALLAIVLYVSKVEAFGVVLVIICLSFCLGFVLFWQGYRPLVKQGKIINSVITDIEFEGQEFTYHTAKTILYLSKEVKGKISELNRTTSNAFSMYPLTIVIQVNDDPASVAFIIKDFFDDYDVINSLIPTPHDNH